MEPKIKILLNYLLNIVGVIIAIVTNKDPKSDVVTFHVRQNLGNIVLSFVIGILVQILAAIHPTLALVGAILYIAVIANWIMGLLAGLKEEEKPMPILGKQFNEWFSFIK